MIITFYIERRHHVTELPRMACQMRMRGDVIQPTESSHREPRGDSGVLMRNTQIREALAYQPEVAHILRLRRHGWTGRFETLNGEVGPSIDTDESFGVRLDVVENVSEQFI